MTSRRFTLHVPGINPEVGPLHGTNFASASPGGVPQLVRSLAGHFAGGERRILIPTAFREDYLLALRALSRERNPRPLLRMLDRAQSFSAAIDFSELSAALPR